MKVLFFFATFDPFCPFAAAFDPIPTPNPHQAAGCEAERPPSPPLPQPTYPPLMFINSIQKHSEIALPYYQAHTINRRCGSETPQGVGGLGGNFIGGHYPNFPCISLYTLWPHCHTAVTLPEHTAATPWPPPSPHRLPLPPAGGTIRGGGGGGGRAKAPFFGRREKKIP